MNSATPASASRPSITFVLCAINVLVFLAAGARGRSLIDIPVDLLAQMGGNVAMLTLTGDGWRLFTSLFLHGGVLHIASNMYMLMLLGPLVQRWYGRTGMLGIYLVGGMWASLTSALWHARSPATELIVSVGASGALMAWCGAMLVTHLLHTDRSEGQPEGAKGGPGHAGALLQVVGINIVLGLFVQGVDQAAHVGGLFAGALLGAAVGLAKRQPGAAWRQKRLALAGIVSAGLLGAATYGGEWPALREVRASWDADVEAGERMEQAGANQHKQEVAERNSQQKATRLREKAAKAQREQLPTPVSAKEATGRVWRFEGKGTSAVLELSGDGREARALDIQQGIIDALDLETGAVTTTRKKLDVNEYYGPFKQVRTDGMSLRRGAEGSLMLVRDSDQAMQRQWGACPVKYMGQSFTVTAAFQDAAGHNVVAATGQQPVVRVTDLETGVDLGFFPTVGYPIDAQFSADGKRLYILSKDSEAGYAARTLSVVDLSKPMADPHESYAGIPLICEWTVGTGE